MTLTQCIARAAIRWLAPLAEKPPEAEDPDADKGALKLASRAELVAMALERQARQGALRGTHHPPPLPPPPTTEEVDSHLRYSAPKPKQPRKRVK